MRGHAEYERRNRAFSRAWARAWAREQDAWSRATTARSNAEHDAAIRTYERAWRLRRRIERLPESQPPAGVGGRP